MKNNVERFLEFNGKRITVLSADGTWWIAVKPICEALGIDYEAQRKGLQSDDFTSQLPSEQTVVAADGKARKMLCLPERYIYGWLFSIRSDSPELREYKKECYDVLYNHFHGTITGRAEALTKRVNNSVEIATLQERLNEKLLLSEEHIRIEALKREQKELEKRLKTLDQDLINGQIVIEFPS